jgi:hypothetical protein
VLLGAATPAPAATAQSSLGISATVVPACRVSTAPDARSASMTCSHLGGGSVDIRRASTESGTDRAPAADPFAARDSARGDGTRYVTVTY